ncbi:RimJ/RimL family protein N-acetyltransferase [Streptomyces sp. V4I8]
MSFEPRTRDQVSEIVARSVASATAEPRREYALAVVERDTKELIGFGRLAMDPHQPRGATFGFALRPDAWGVGYGLETVRLLLGFGFEELDLHRIWGARSPRNEASANVPRQVCGSLILV